MASKNIIVEAERQIPVLRTVEILVVGGGSGGWSAAVAAARLGRKVLLVDTESALGGTSTVSMMHLFGAPYDHYHGLMKEVADDLIEMGEAVPGPLVPYDGEAYKRLLFRKVQEAGVELLLNTWFSTTIVEAGVVRGVVVESKAGRQAIMADVVIDATGDGDVAARAGAKFITGRAADGKMRPMTLLFRLGNVDSKKLIEWAEANPEQFKNDSNSHIIDHERQLYRLHGFFGLVADAKSRNEVDEECHYMRFEYVWPSKSTALVNTTRVYDVSGLDAFDITKAVLEARRQMDMLVAFIKAYVPGCDHCFVIDSGQRLGIRETRHIVGDYILQEDDLAGGVHFSDTVFSDHRRMVPGAAVHSPDGKEGSEIDTLERNAERTLFKYYIPYRIFLPAGLDRILISGRAFSADHQADGWTRDIPGIVLAGQAVGTAAALAIHQGRTPRDVDLDEVRDALSKAGVDTGAV